MKPATLGLAFSDFREGQLEVAGQIAGSQKEFFILQAPPGSGKSMVAMTTSRLAQEIAPEPESWRTIITVATKQLQSQYVRDFNIPQMFGRGNFLCAKSDERTTCDYGLCQVKRGCTREEKWFTCHYHRQKKQVAKARECVLNIAYFLYESNYVGEFRGADLLVLDEGHLLENMVSQFVGISFYRSVFQRLRLAFPEVKTVGDVVTWAEDCELLVEAKLMAINGRIERSQYPDEVDVRAVTRLEQIHKSLNTIQAEVAKDPEMWALYSQLESFEVKPILVSSYSHKVVFEKAKKKLIMSATILDPEEYAFNIGIPKGSYEWVDIPSTFEPNNRPVNYWPVAKVSGKTLQDSLQKVASAIDQVAAVFPEEKGVIHTVSYGLTKLLVENCSCSDRFIHHLRRTRDDAIRDFMATSEPAILISPSVTIGLDLPGDAGRFLIVAKLQFPDLSDPIVQAKMHLSNKWYAWQTACALVQSTGRIVRTEEDYGTSVILDQNLTWFSRKYSNLLPVWWKEAFYVLKNGISSIKIATGQATLVSIGEEYATVR